MNLNPPAVVVTEAPAGVPATTLGRLMTQHLETVVFVPSPSRIGKAGVAFEVLEALGKRWDVTGKPRNATSQAELVPLWLTAHRTRRLIATPCQQTSPRDLLDLVDMTQATPTQVVLACDYGFSARLLSQIVAADPTYIEWPEVPATHPYDDQQNEEHAPDVPASIAETALPVAEYWTFYATARRLLSPTQFAHLSDLYGETSRRITEWLGDLHSHGADLTVDLAHGSLKTLIEEQVSLDCVTVVLRAAQAAYHRAGWFLDIDERELRNGLIRFPPSKTTPALYDRLRAYSEPSRAATVGLYLAGATPNAIRLTTLNDLTHWHQDPRHHVADVAVPEAAAPYLRAALFARAVDGAAPEAAAFPGDSRRARLDIRQAAGDLGINIGDANLDDTSAVGARRVPSRVIKLERLT